MVTSVSQHLCITYESSRVIKRPDFLQCYAETIDVQRDGQ